MNNLQIATLQKLVNTIQECEAVGLTLSYASLMINVEDDESHYLENLSSDRLITLLNFIDGCGASKKYEQSARLDNPQTPESCMGYDNGSGDYNCTTSQACPLQTF